MYTDYTTWFIAYEGGDDDPKPDDSKLDDPKPDSFSQLQVDTLLDEQRSKFQKVAQKAIDEAQAATSKLKLNESAQKELQERLENVQNSLKTKDELADQERKKLETQLTTDNQVLKDSAELWRSRFTESTIHRSIVDAAATAKAFNTAQLVAILRPTTKLVEILDDEGKPTGDMKSVVSFIDNSGKEPVTLQISPTEAIKKMTEMDEFANLFNDDSAGGTGRRSTSKGADLDIGELARDGEAYRAQRDTLLKQGRI